MSFENCYISSNCNQTPTIADWGRNSLICYGSCNAVLIYNPKFGSGGKIIDTLISHSKRVNSVRWIRGQHLTKETELVSGSADGTAVLWNIEHKSSFVLKGHESIVNIVDGLYKGSNNDELVIITCSMDCTIKVWTRFQPQDEIKLTQTIKIGYDICMGLKAAFIPKSSEIIFAAGFSNSKICLYTEDTDNNNQFISTTTLAGHEDWIRGLDFTEDERGDLLLASSSQDHLIRLWRISKTETETSNSLKIKTKTSTYIVALESVITGHEGWIYSVNWSPTDLQLLSASIDKSMIIWEFDKTSGLWVEKIRVGEVGGNTLGFYGGVFGPDGNSVLAHSYHGAFHIWTQNSENLIWEPVVTIGGHYNEVVDVAWEPEGEFLVSLSTDQTTRIHGPWNRDNKGITWHEIARPQVHGYDMSALAIISRYKFASAAEEKIVRTFQAPKNFVENFRRICNISTKDVEGDSITDSSQSEPKGASVPSLGLSNKAVFTNDNSEQAQAVDKKNPYPEESYFTATDMIEPPTEENLVQNTLWPENQKLYGHGYEVYSLAASPDGKYLASACKSTTAEHAAILLWDTTNWNQVQKLMSHTLTIAQLQFSPDSNHLLSVSRDRRWTLFTKDQSSQLFELKATTDKKTSIHTRIIWSCSWSHDSKYFVTGSRDAKVVIWTINPDKVVANVLGKCEAVGQTLTLGDSVTALAFAPDLVNEQYLLAVGLDSGLVYLYKWSEQGWKEALALSKSEAHHLTVKRLTFRPKLGQAGVDDDKQVLQLASGSSDYSVRIYNIFIDKL